jgi:hypothetical protein
MKTLAMLIKIGPAFRAPRAAPEWVCTANHATLNALRRCGAVTIEDGTPQADAFRAAQQISEGR